MIKNIFIYWNSGFENCPTIVTNCLNSCKYYNKNYNIIELNDDNLSNYINIDEIIKCKNITKTSLSYIIRIFLLKKYGGCY